MGLVNKSKLEEIKNICESIRNSELQTENQETKRDIFKTLEVGLDAIDNSETKENMFSCFDVEAEINLIKAREEEQVLEEIVENVGESNIRALEEKFKNDTLPSTVIRPVKQYNGHGKMEITEAAREACADSVVRFSESKPKTLRKTID